MTVGFPQPPRNGCTCVEGAYLRYELDLDCPVHGAVVKRMIAEGKAYLLKLPDLASAPEDSHG